MTTIKMDNKSLISRHAGRMLAMAHDESVTANTRIDAAAEAGWNTNDSDEWHEAMLRLEAIACDVNQSAEDRVEASARAASLSKRNESANVSPVTGLPRTGEESLQEMPKKETE